METQQKADEYEWTQVITRHFNKSEMRSLASACGIDYEDLPGRTPNAFASDLVRHMQRRQKLEVLKAAIVRERRGIKFDGLVISEVPVDVTEEIKELGDIDLTLAAEKYRFEIEKKTLVDALKSSKHKSRVEQEHAIINALIYLVQRS